MKNKISISLIFVSLFIFASHHAAFAGSWLSPVQLTHNTAADQVPVINAEGTRIVYYGNDDGDDDIYVLAYDSGSWQQPQKLTFNATPDTMPSINASGDRIAYIGGPEGARGIYFIECRDGSWQAPEKISDSQYNDYFPSMNADGTRIVFQSKDEQGHRFIRLLEQPGGMWDEPATLPDATSNNMFPVINADGTKVAFYAEQGGYRHIYFTEHKDDRWLNPLKLTDGDEQNIQPSINAGGTSIVYYWTGEQFLPHVQPGATAEIRIVEYREGNWQSPVTIANSQLYEFDPTINGEGNRVVFSESNPGHPETVYVVERSNESWLPPVNLTKNAISGFRPYINGAGDKIVCYGTRTTDSDYEVYLLNYDPSAGGILGKVTIAPGGEPLESSLVIAEPGGYISITDATGYYDLHVPVGSYTVNVYADCFASSYAADVAVATGEATEKNFSLSQGNCFPRAPESPSPYNGASNQAIISLLQWECSDPDADSLVYDVLLGTETEHHIQLETVASNLTRTFYQTKPLNFATAYYWQIIARDERGGEQAGPLWYFTTQDCPLSLLLGDNDEAIALLRNFRDTMLNNTPQGRELIRLYYQWGPAIVRVMETDEQFKNEMKEVIDSLLAMMRNAIK